MHKFLKFTMMMLVVASMGFAFSSCSEEPDEPATHAKSLVGKWVYDDPNNQAVKFIYDLKKDGTYIIDLEFTGSGDPEYVAKEGTWATSTEIETDEEGVETTINVLTLTQITIDDTTGDEVYTDIVYTYTVSGKTLKITDVNGRTKTLTKK